MATTIAGTVSLPTKAAGAGLPASAQLQGEAGLPYAVDVDVLHGLIEHEPTAVRTIDVSPLRSYRDSHIPGSIHEFWEDTVDREYPHFGAVVTQGENQRQRIDFVRKLAVDSRTNIVVYDDSAGYRAARIVWYLRFLGLERVSLLDGGLASWTGAGFPARSGVETVESAGSAAVAPREGFYVVTRQLLDRIATQQPAIVDTRTDSERADDLDGSIPTGAIPGSIRFPWTSMVDVDAGRLRDPVSFEAGLQEAGLAPGQHIIVYAQFGVDAALPWLALKHLGYPNVETYDRGWVEWASRPDLPRDPI